MFSPSTDHWPQAQKRFGLWRISELTKLIHRFPVDVYVGWKPRYLDIFLYVNPTDADLEIDYHSKQNLLWVHSHNTSLCQAFGVPTLSIEICLCRESAEVVWLMQTHGMEEENILRKGMLKTKIWRSKYKAKKS